jgi:hypothetical protein
MRRFTFQRLVACICLLAFGLNTMVFARGLVRCTDENGSTRMEWGCEKDGLGHCRVVCDGSADQDEPIDHPESEPCDDTPATTTLVMASRAVSAKDLTLPPRVEIAAFAATIFSAWSDLERSPTTPPPRSRAGPKPAQLTAWRSIRLQV